MKRILCAAVVMALAAAGPGLTAQDTRTHSETTTKSKGSKIKSKTVVGTVKEFEAGKKIVVTGPKNKDYSFDLDEKVSMTGPVAVGDRVKVKYTKVDGHEKVSVVSSYKGKT